MEFERLDYDSRTEKFGVIAKIKFDNPSDEDKRTLVHPNYKDLMRTGEWIDEQSSDPDNKRWEWGTPTDYLGKGTKLLLYDKSEHGIIVIADIIPKEAFYDDENHHTVRNVMVGKPEVLVRPISPVLIVSCNLKDPERLGPIPFEEITEAQYNELMEKYKNLKKQM